MNSPFLGFGSEQALRAFADVLADGVFTTDAKGVITYWNPAAERITGWTRAEAIGQDCSLLAGDVVSGCACGGGPFFCGLAEEGRRSKQCMTRARDGRFRVIVKSAVTIRDASGNAIGALESFTPVQEEQPRPVHVCGGRHGLVGRHPLMLDLYRLIELVAQSPATVLIVGESGAGKDRVAEAIHAASPRAASPLVRVPCAAIDGWLQNDGSAVPSAPGADANPFSAACGGTILLDEVGDLSAEAQVKLLRFMEARERRRAGEAEGCDVRVLCTTHGDLKRAVDERTMRADLYFRLNVFPLRVPALREHVEDVPLIAERLFADRVPRLSPEARFALVSHDWPGNVRELQNVLEYAMLRSGGEEIRPEHLPPDFGVRSSPCRAPDERAQLAEALARCGGNRTLAARALGISRVTLWKRMKKHGVCE